MRLRNSVKYLYLIFRLFKCPHKFKLAEEYKATKIGTTQVMLVVRVYECTKCGKAETLEI